MDPHYSPTMLGNPPGRQFVGRVRDSLAAARCPRHDRAQAEWARGDPASHVGPRRPKVHGKGTLCTGVPFSRLDFPSLSSMPWWSDSLLSEWPQFVAVFLGAALGAVLTVWLTDRSHKRRAMEAAYEDAQAALNDVYDDRTGRMLPLSHSVVGIKRHAVGRGRRRVTRAGDKLIELLASLPAPGSWSSQEWRQVSDALNNVGEAIYGPDEGVRMDLGQPGDNYVGD